GMQSLADRQPCLDPPDQEERNRRSWRCAGKNRQCPPGLCHGGIMSRLHSVLCLSLVMAVPLALGGCAGVLVVGGLAGAAGGGYAAAQERGVDGVVNDWEVQNDIQKGLMKAQPGLEEGITTTVYQG